MKIIKENDYFIAYDKQHAEEIIESIKDKKLCILDFECFQYPDWTKAKIPNIKINDIPFTVCMNTMHFDNGKNVFISKNEKVYQFTKGFNDEDSLL